MKRIMLIVAALGLLIVGVGVMYMVKPSAVLSPLSSSPWFSFEEPSPQQRSQQDLEVIGYLPFWNVAKSTIQPELTALAYFSLTIGPDGELLTRDDDGNADPGYNRLGSDTWLQLAATAREQQTGLEITFTQLNNADIEAFLSSPTATQTFLRSLDSALLAYPFTGVHLDVEYVGTPTAELRSAFVDFVTAVNLHLEQRYKELPLRVAIYAGAAEKYQLWDLPALEPHVDSFVVMAYDFHRASSSVAGPVAPLYGNEELWEGDINHYLQTLLSVLPSQKIILGVPFYGYQWQTTEPTPLSSTFPRTGSTASFDRVQDLIASSLYPITVGWNEQALSPYLTYTEPVTGKHYVIFYEDGRSLRYKLELVQQLELGGIAIWALGYEGSRRELWDAIKSFGGS